MPDAATELLDPAADEVSKVQREEAANMPKVQHEAAADAPVEVIAADLLVEEISIDGMCGVY